MFENYDMFTGQLKYNDIEFTFVFNKKKLILIPKSTRYIDISKIKSSIFYEKDDKVSAEKRYLLGTCNETLNNMVFLIDKYCDFSSFNSIIHINVVGYIVFFRNECSIGKMNFSCTEINYIHPASQVLDCKLIFNNDRKIQLIEITPQDSGYITTKKQTFIFEEKEITSYFSIYAGIKSEIHKAPFNLNSLLIFEFEPTDNYNFIMQLFFVAWSFICFLCYRNNIYINNIDLFGIYNNKYIKTASLHMIGHLEKPEDNPLVQGRYIKQKYIAGYEGRIFSDIVNDTMYVAHIPSSYFTSHSISTGRFIMIMAAFEWEFKKLFPDGVEHSDKTKESEEIVSEQIQKLVDSSAGRTKNIYKFLKRLVKSDSLKNKIIHACNSLSGILEKFKDKLYHNYDCTSYTDIGNRVSEQRNHFAHGDIDKEFIDLSLLDLLFIEYIIYAMQLKYYGVDDENIKKSINDLFHCGLSF